MMAASTVKTPYAFNSTNFDTLEEPVRSTTPTSSRKEAQEHARVRRKRLFNSGQGKTPGDICTHSTRSLCKAAVLTPTDKQHNFNFNSDSLSETVFGANGAIV